METFKSLVKAVEENNRINDGKWSDWSDAFHIERTYGELSIKERSIALEFLSALIRDNGENLEIYLDAMDCLQYGQPFKR